MSTFINVLSFRRCFARIKMMTIGLMAIALIVFFQGSAIAASHKEIAANHPAAFLAQVSDSTTANENENVSTAALFTKNCAGCHAHGGNVIRRNKTLKQKALKRYGYDDVTKIAQIITHGRGIMPAYGERLSTEEVGAIAQYVKTQSETGWQN